MKIRDLSSEMTDAELIAGLAAYAQTLFTGMAKGKTFSAAYRSKCRALAARFETLAAGKPARRTRKAA